MRIVIDPDRCTGHGLCYAVAPALIGDDDRGYGVALPVPLSPAALDLAGRAVASCPEQAVSVVAD